MDHSEFFVKRSKERMNRLESFFRKLDVFMSTRNFSSEDESELVALFIEMSQIFQVNLIEEVCDLRKSNTEYKEFLSSRK